MNFLTIFKNGGEKIILTPTEIFFWVATHVFLFFICLSLLYLFLLELWRKREERVRALFLYSGLGFLSAFSAFIIDGIYLRDYYAGKLGFVSEESTAFLHQLVFYRNILLPLSVILIASIVGSVWYAGRFGASQRFKMALIFMTLSAGIVCFFLILLGIFTP